MGFGKARQERCGRSVLLAPCLHEEMKHLIDQPILTVYNFLYSLAHLFR